MSSSVPTVAAAPVRPDPDALLAQVMQQERRALRGKLRIYFGASAGVGKTYSMLVNACKLKAEGQDVVAGIVETHGRSETAAMLGALEILPLKVLDYRGSHLKEFDLNAALARRPALILVDELAHSNLPGSRHPKRWQDVEELLNAGINVFTTVNVQHLESLNDVVGGITGIRVTETLPDSVFDSADEVVLVDLPADELLARLAAGKVYQPHQAKRAVQHFFRKGNLIALRELALRRTAERIENDVQAYRSEQAIDAVWKTDPALLVAVGSRAGSEHVIRSAARLANQLNAEWHAVYIETPKLQRLPPAQREYILKMLKMAQDLGAKTAVLAGQDIAASIVHYARQHNLSKILFGRGNHNWTGKPRLGAQLDALAPDIDLTEVGRAPLNEASAVMSSSLADKQTNAQHKQRYWHLLIGAAASLLTALIAMPLLPFFDLANIVMLFLLTVVLVAVQYGRGPSVVATIVGVASFDFFFVTPRFSLAFSDVQYVMTFSVMLTIGLITAHLTSGLRYQARVASHRESRARALYEFARSLSGVLQTEQIFETTRLYVQRTFGANATLLLPDETGHLQLPAQAQEGAAAPLDAGIAQWAFDHASPAGMGTDTLPGSVYFYLPLVAPMRTRGVLVLKPDNRRWSLIPEQRQQLDTFATLAAIALERVHYIEVAQAAMLSVESEHLRNSLLAALSHDLRTPLTSIMGLAESLALSTSPLSAKDREFATALHEESQRMNNLVSNLLDMARMQSGTVKLNLQWHSLEGIVGSALRASASMLRQHVILTSLAADLPLIRVDAILIERVLSNLLENAAKYTPAGSVITVSAAVGDSDLIVTISDNGPGLPSGKEASLFEKFARGQSESVTPGVGLGLAICRAIVDAHGGSIRAENLATGGAAFIFSLPLGTPPTLSDMESDEGKTHE